jgi:hypothetical protein
VTEPSRKDRTRPVELLLISGGIAVFVGLIVLMSTRQWILALIFTGVGFILALVVLAMLALAVRPDGEEQLDLDDQDRAGH